MQRLGSQGMLSVFCEWYICPWKTPLHYGNFQQRYRFPAIHRDPVSNREYGRQADSASSCAERKHITRDTGVTGEGESIFYHFFVLCRFDPVQDAVIDAMHALALNLIRTELADKLLADLGANSTLHPQERLPLNGGLLDRNDLARALSKVDWTTEMKNGRLPQVYPSQPHGKHKLGYWKWEEFSRFAEVAPVVLHSIVPKKAYDCFHLLHQIHKFIFSTRLRIQGWCRDHRQMLKQLLWHHAVLYEELYGLSACSENLEYSLLMPEDITRHSTLDNYWCFVYERQVKYYKRQTTNMRSLCKTFADRAAQLQFVQVNLDTNFAHCQSGSSQFNI